jgi:hypothetical protein
MYKKILNNASTLTEKDLIIKELRKIYSEALIDDILNNKDPLTQYYFNKILLNP